MTVHELIEQLQQVKDKSIDVVCPKGFLIEMIFINIDNDVQMIIDSEQK